jgi:hypothetical protein
LSFADKGVELDNIILGEVSQVRKPKVISFLSYVKYRSNTNLEILWKMGHTEGRSHTREGVKKRNMVNVLPIQE